MTGLAEMEIGSIAVQPPDLFANFSEAHFLKGPYNVYDPARPIRCRPL